MEEFNDLIKKFEDRYIELGSKPNTEYNELKEYINLNISKAEKPKYQDIIISTINNIKNKLKEIKENEKLKKKQFIEKQNEEEQKRIQTEYDKKMELFAQNGMEWVNQLEVNKKTLEIKSTTRNFEIIIDNTYKIFTIKEAKRRIFDDHILTDDDTSKMKSEIEYNWGLYNKNKFNEALTNIAASHYISMQDKMFSIDQPKEDKTDYLEYFLDSWEWNKPIKEITYIFRKFLSNVYLSKYDIYKGRRNRDIMLVIKGNQGLGKSSLCKTLGMVDWKNDGHNFLSRFYSIYNVLSDVNNMRSQEFIYDNSRALITEWAEFQGGNRAEVTKVKALTSQRQTDKRRAYKENEEYYIWNGVIFITTNDTKFLKDTTGNRRFGIIEITKFKHPERIQEMCENEGEKLFWMWNSYGKWIDKNDFDKYTFNSDDINNFEYDNNNEMYYMQDENADKINGYIKQEFPDNWDNMSEAQQKKFLFDPYNDNFTNKHVRTKFTLEELVEFGLGLVITNTTKKTTKKLLDNCTGIIFNSNPYLMFRGTKKRYYEIIDTVNGINLNK